MAWSKSSKSVVFQLVSTNFDGLCKPVFTLDCMHLVICRDDNMNDSYDTVFGEKSELKVYVNH
jgi:hypothetical protein